MSLVTSRTHSHKDSGSMGSRDGVEERDTVLVRGFCKAGTKKTLRFWDRISVSGSRNGTLDPESCDYGRTSAYRGARIHEKEGKER